MSTNGSRKWWLIGGAWALLLVGLGFWSALRDPATVHDQSALSIGKNKIDHVVGQVSGSLPAGWLLSDAGYLETTCKLTPWRDGVHAERTLTLSGPSGGASETLSKVASTLDSSRAHDSDTFYYDAGDFVAVRGRVTGAGTVGIFLSTGCRPQ